MSEKRIGNVKTLSKELQVIKELALKNKITISQVLLRLADSAEDYFATDQEGVFARIRIDEQIKIININSQHFENWLRNQYYELLNKTTTTSQLREVIQTLRARELMSTKTRKKTRPRVSEEQGKLYINLMNERNEAVEIGKGGWKIKEFPSSHFEKLDSASRLDSPKVGGDLSKLKKYLTVEGDDYLLILSFIIACFMPNGPYPILILQGSQGSGKSFLSKIIKKIVDPSDPEDAMILSPPKDEKDLLISARSHYLLAFDNLSGIDSDMSDKFCKLATGIAIISKKLYTDKDASVIAAKRPQILNGIDYIATRGDLADRSIIISLPKMSERMRRDEESLWSDFNNDLPDILGGIYDILSVILANYKSTNLVRTSRMADYVKWITAGETSLGIEKGKFIEIYEINKKEAALEALEKDILAYSIFEIINERNELIGNSTFIIHQLTNKLNRLGIIHKENWMPINKLKDSLLRIEPVLNRVNIQYEYKRGKERIHRLYKVVD